MVRTNTGIRERLLSLAFFAGLAPDDVAHLATGTTEVPAPRGTILFRDGNVCTGLYFVVTGQVKLSLQAGKGQEKVLRLAGEGESLSEVALFLGRRHRTTAEAISDTTLLHVAKEIVLQEVGRSTEFARRVIGELCRQLDERTLDLQSYLLLSGRQRVIGYLLSRLPAEINGRPAVIMLPAKKGIIASRLNLTHEHFSHILHELAAGELIEVDGRAVRVPDVHRLDSQRDA